jgi:alpha-D-xyloside xylohydrolase
MNIFSEIILGGTDSQSQYTPEKFIKTDENEGWNKTDATRKIQFPI